MKRLFLALLMASGSCFAAISGSSVFEIRTAGSDTNGGGYVTGSSGTDMSQFNNANSAGCSSCQSASANLSVTNATTTVTTTVTSATAAFSAAIVGNIVFVTIGGGSCVSGTVPAQWRQVATFVNVTTITLDVAPTGSGTTCTGITLNVGGALLSPGQSSAIMVSGNISYLLNSGSPSIFSITSATANISGGAMANAGQVLYVGYATNRAFGNTDSPPTIQLNVSTATIAQSVSQTLFNINFDGNSQTASKLSSGGIFEQGIAKGFNTLSSGGSYYKNFGATANSAAVLTGTVCIDCDAWANTATPISVSVCVRCTSASNTGATTDGFSGTLCEGCSSVSNGRFGFNFSSGSPYVCDNCIAESNTNVGFNCAIGQKTLINPSAFGNSAAISGTCLIFNSIPGSTSTAVFAAPSSVFVSAPTNLALNNTAGAGAALRNASYPSVFPRGTSTTYLDVGAIRHQDPAGSTSQAAYAIQ